MAGKLAQAHTCYAQVVAQDKRHSAALHGLSMIACAEQQFDRAVRFAERAIEAQPHIAHFYNTLGISYEATGQDQKALHAFQKAVALKPDHEPAIPECLKSCLVTNLGEHFKDFSDTAAAIAHMNLVISVDTSVLHLACAMGKPTWALIPYIPDWRWMLDRTDSPWYPTLRLFRQAQPGQWQPVFKTITESLHHTVQTHRSR